MSEHELIVKSFHGTTVRVEFFDEELFFDISGVARKFGKKLAEWENLKSTQEYFNALKSGRESSTAFDFIIRGETGSSKAYIHKKVFVEFARWVNIDFNIWANNIIEEILFDGKVLCEKERAEYISQIKQLKERSYAKPRTGDFQLVDRIRQDYNIQISTHELNLLLESQGIIIDEPYMVSSFEPNEENDFAIKQGKSTLVYIPTVLGIVDNMEIERGLGFEDINQRLF